MARSSVSIDSEWQARMDCDTLIEARKIEADPKRYKAALAEAKKRRDAIDSTMAAEMKAADSLVGQKKSAG